MFAKVFSRNDYVKRCFEVVLETSQELLLQKWGLLFSLPGSNTRLVKNLS